MSSDTARDDDRRTAVVVGVLFLVALVLHLVGGAIYGPATGSGEFLESAYPDRGLVTLGVLIEFVAVASIPLIGFFMFPVLKRFNEALALAYAGLRSVEAVLLMTIEGKILSLIDLSQDHLDAKSTDEPPLQAIGDAVISENDSTFVVYVLVFGVGALIFYAMLYRSKLVPPWLSIWGLAAAAWMVIGTVLVALDAFSGASDALVQVVFVLPIPLNELALAAWLITKGFDQRPALRGTR